MPASWLDLQLSYLNSLTKARTQAQTSINFTNLRDAAHLCLHATQTFIEEVVNHQDVKAADIEHQQHLMCCMNGSTTLTMSINYTLLQRVGNLGF